MGISKWGALQLRVLVALATGPFVKDTPSGPVRAASLGELAAVIGLPYDSVRKALPSLVRRGLVLRLPGTVNGHPGWLFVLTQSGAIHLHSYRPELERMAVAGLLSQDSIAGLREGGLA